MVLSGVGGGEVPRHCDVLHPLPLLLRTQSSSMCL